MARLEFPDEIKLLIERLKKLPGIGPKGAERIAVWLINQDGQFADIFADAVQTSSKFIKACEKCGFFESKDNKFLLNERNAIKEEY